jgi:hypothetical protein
VCSAAAEISIQNISKQKFAEQAAILFENLKNYDIQLFLE